MKKMTDEKRTVTEQEIAEQQEAERIEQNVIRPDEEAFLESCVLNCFTWVTTKDQWNTQVKEQSNGQKKM